MGGLKCVMCPLLPSCGTWKKRGLGIGMRAKTLNALKHCKQKARVVTRMSKLVSADFIV